jgi:transposase
VALRSVDIQATSGLPALVDIRFKTANGRSVLNRLILKDEQWERVTPLLPGKVSDPGRSGADNRLFLEAVLWMVRTGAPWRDLPEAFGHWNSVFRRIRRWAQTSVFEHVFQALSGDPDFEYALIDGTIIRVHQHGTGAKGGPPRSWPWWMRWATWRTSNCFQVSAMTVSEPSPCSTGSRSALRLPTRASTLMRSARSLMPGVRRLSSRPKLIGHARSHVTLRCTAGAI